MVARSRPLVLALLPALLVASCSTLTGEDPDGVTAADAPASFVVTITAPKPSTPPPLNASKTLTLSATVVPVKGVKVSKVEVIAGGGKFAATQNGTTFTAEINVADEKDDKGKPRFSCNKIVPFVVNATGAKQESASASVDVELDFCAPQIDLALGPVDSERCVEASEPPCPFEACFKGSKQCVFPPLVDNKVPPPSTKPWVGKVRVWLNVREKAFAKGTVSLKVGDDTDVSLVVKDGLVAEVAVPKAGIFDILVDRAGKATANVTIGVTVTDKGGTVGQANATARIIRAPSFMGDAGSAENFGPDIRDFQLGDMDGDGIHDAVVLTATELVLRLGLPAKDPKTGQPIQGKGSGRFDPVIVPVTLGPDGKPEDLTVTEGVRLNKLNLKLLRLADLDGDKDLDVIAVGQIEPGKQGAMAFLNSKKETKDKTNAVKVTTVLKLIDRVELPDEALSMALADLEKNGSPDLIVGAKPEHKGLTVVRVNVTPDCSATEKGGKTVCNGITDLAKMNFANIFLDKQTISQKGVTGVKSIAIGDFYADEHSYPDVCVGEETRPFISCYRNKRLDDGAFQLQQAQDSYYAVDAPETGLIITAEWSDYPAGADGPDLIMSNAKYTRWLKGDHKGHFSYDPKTFRQFVGGGVVQMAIANVGPVKGDSFAPYLVYVQGGRRLGVVPVLDDDESMTTECFRSWVLGGSIDRFGIADIDKDGKLDVVGLDHAPPGLVVGFARGVGDFALPDVFHLCAAIEGVFGVKPQVAMAVEDFNADKLPELLLIGLASHSMQPGISGCCPTTTGGCVPKPVWPMHVYMNQLAELSPRPRAAEFAPYAKGQFLKSGGTADCPDTPKPFGSVTGIDVGFLDGDDKIDLVMVRDGSNYTAGLAPAPAAGLCPHCLFDEAKEVETSFGIESPETGLPAANCCKNFKLKDTKKEDVLKGYKGGAPLDRASMFVWLNTFSNNEPFGFTVDGLTKSPVVVAPTLSVAGGRNPIGVAVADFNKDNAMDIATLMPEDGVNTTLYDYWEARIRVFKGNGAGGFSVAPQKDKWDYIDPKSTLRNQQINVTYRRVGPKPASIQTAPLCPDKVPGVLTLSKVYGNVTTVVSQGNMSFDPYESWTVGPGAQAFSARNVDADNPGAPGAQCTDLLFALKSTDGETIGYVRGEDKYFNSKVELENRPHDAVAMETADVNQDGFLDVVVLDKKSATVEFLVGDGTGSFVRHAGAVRALSQPMGLRLRDLDGDGCLDLVVQSEIGTVSIPYLGCPKP